MEKFKYGDVLHFFVYRNVNRSRQHYSRPRASVVFAGVLALHIIFIFFAIKDNRSSNLSGVQEVTLHFLQVSPEKERVVTPTTLPDIEIQSRRIQLTFPTIDAMVFDVIDANASANSNPTLQSGQKVDSVFDPKLRKKLHDSEMGNTIYARGDDRSWTSPDGKVLVDLGDGHCMSSMKNMDSRSRGTTWSSTSVSCGESDSEKFMDHVNAELESKKHPLH